MSNNKKPRIGLALGGGGVRGGAHVGVLKVLEEYGIEIDLIAGTSAGSVVAALFAHGYTADDIAGIFVNAELTDLLSLRPSRMGLMTPTGCSKLIKQHTNDGRIENCKIPLYIVTADLISRRQIVFTEGETALAVHASSAIPGLMNPVRHNGMLLADGGILNNCPADIVRNAGADIVLAVNLHCIANFEPKNTMDIIFRAMDMVGDSITGDALADWLVYPIDEPIGILEKHMIEKSMHLGEKAARASINQLLAILDKFSA